MKELTEASNFYRLPGNVINNELYVALKMLNNMSNTIKSGNDFDKKQFDKIISSLQKISKSSKKFSDGDEVPLSYQYKS